MPLQGKQQGAALITVLIFMVVLAMIGRSSMQGSALEERMAANEWEQSRAFQAAESGLRDGIQWLLLQPTDIEATDDGSNGVWSSSTVTPDIAGSTFDWDTSGQLYGSGTSNNASSFSDLYKPPRYTVEEFQFVPDNKTDAITKREGYIYYTISAIGYGRTEAARSVLQTVYKKRSN